MPQTYCRDDPVSGRWTGVNRLLTEYEVDDNFYSALTRIVTLENNAHLTVSVSYITMVGQQITFHMTDHTTQGPFTVPVATFRDRGTWAAFTVYSVNDTFQENGACYLTIFPHTSQASFDPNANDGLGHNYYLTLLSLPGNSLPAGGAAKMMLTKVDGHDYHVAWSYPVPVGGTSAQILSKVSSADFDMAWVTPPAGTFQGLSDVNVTEGPGIDGYSVKWNDSAAKWVAYLPSAGSATLAGLTDVAITSPQQFDHLEYDGAHWVNEYRGQINIGTVSGSHAIDPLQASVYTITPSGAVTITQASGAPPGMRTTLKVATSGTTSYDVSFGTGFAISGDLFTGVVNNVVYTIDFVMDFSGTLCEVGRSKPIPQVVTLGTTGTVSLDPTVGHEVFTMVPSGAVTLNASSAPVGKRATLIITTSGTSSFNVTPTTNFKSTGALATGVVSGKVFTISFIGDGTNMNEVSRTGAM